MRKIISSMIVLIGMAVIILAGTVEAQEQYTSETLNNCSTENIGPRPGTYCSAYEVYDCSGKCVDFDTALNWIADEYCDDGSYGIDLKCQAFFFDGSDCYDDIVTIHSTSPVSAFPTQIIPIITPGATPITLP